MENKPLIRKARLRRLNIRLSQQEWDKVNRLSSNSTCRSVSEYARKVLSEKPVKVFYRNRSFDDFEEQMTNLLPRLETFGEAFAEMVRKMSPKTDYPSEEMISALLECGQGFSKIAEEIKIQVQKLADQGDKLPGNATENNHL